MSLANGGSLPGIGLTFDGRNVNIPWPDQGMGDGDYVHAFQEVVMPIATEFDPDLVISKASTCQFSSELLIQV